VKLAEWLETEHSVAERVQVMLALVRALGTAHQAGRCHGDAVSPAKIDVLPDGQIRLSGAAKELEESPYRAPERDKGVDPSPRSDVFSAGTILYEILAGHHPYAGESLTGLLVVDFKVQPIHLRQIGRGISSDLADAIMACIEKEPDRRPRDLGQVARHLQQDQGAPPAQPRAAAPAASRASSPAPAAQARRGGASPRPPRSAEPSSSRNLVMILGVLVLAVGGAAAWYFLQGQGRPGPTRAAAAPATTMPAVAPDAGQPEAPTPAPEAEGQSTQEPAAKPHATPEPTPEPTPTPMATPEPTPLATAAPVAAAATPPPRATPVPTPVATPQPTPPPAPAGPAVISYLSPPSLQRRANVLVDVRGSGLRPDHRPLILRKGRPADSPRVTRQKHVGPELIQLVLEMNDKTPTGEYTLLLVGPDGVRSNAVVFQVAH
jgi:hypothetical protein